jgi:hypothetical protein
MPSALFLRLMGTIWARCADHALTRPNEKPRDMRGFLVIGAGRFELPTSCPPDKRANQAAPRPVGDKSNGRASRPRDLSGGIASDASGPPDNRANQAAPRPATTEL